MKYKYLVPFCLFLLIFTLYLIIYLEDSVQEKLVEEDGLIETLGAGAFFLASILCIYCFYASKGRRTKLSLISFRRNVFFLLLGLLFFVAAGEEISWGQRIFSWETPASWQSINSQKETNLHNLVFFVNRPRNDQGKLDLVSTLLVFNVGRLFFFFWFTFLLLIPAVSLVSSKWKYRFRSIRLPMAPVWIGLLMLVNLTLSWLFVYMTDFDFSKRSGIDEVRETNYAIIIAYLAIHWTLFRTYQSDDKRYFANVNNNLSL
ncbi:MAG: hypothetical protein ACR2MX_15500 [Cyclobacteriaceae bacterium]